MTAIADVSEPTIPFPPRFRRTKRIALISSMLIVGYIALMWWLRYEARARLDAELQSIRARGEPILLEDFQTPSVSDTDNSALSLLNATKSLALTQAESDYIYRFDLYAPVDDQARQMLAQIGQSSAQARQLARLARVQKGVDWGVRYRSPVIATLLPHLNGMRELANVLQRVAQHEQLSGNDAEAVEVARDILRESNVLLRDNPCLVTSLVACGISQLDCELVRALSLDLQVLPGSNATSRPTGPASRQQVQALIAELLDDATLRRGFHDGMQTERMMEYDIATHPASLGVWATNFIPIVRVTYQPIFDLDAIRIMDNTPQVMRAVQADNFQAAEALMPHPDRDLTSVSTAGGATRLMSRIIMPSFNRVSTTQFRAIAARRVAALRLAIRVYQLDHDGAFPASLEELVPAYIPGVPLDPFTSDGRKLGYRSSPQPFIYGVGEDGVDNGGDTTLPSRRPPTTAPAGSPDDNWTWERRDVIFPLTRYVRPPPPPSDEN
jgi:hypothetical protein